MDPRFVAHRIMSAVLRNKKSVCIPKVLYGLAALKSILPPKAFMLLADFVLQPTRPNYEFDYELFERMKKNVLFFIYGN